MLLEVGFQEISLCLLQVDLFHGCQKILKLGEAEDLDVELFSELLLVKDWDLSKRKPIPVVEKEVVELFLDLLELLGVGGVGLDVFPLQVVGVIFDE